MRKVCGLIAAAMLVCSVGQTNLVAAADCEKMIEITDQIQDLPQDSEEKESAEKSEEAETVRNSEKAEAVELPEIGKLNPGTEELNPGTEELNPGTEDMNPGTEELSPETESLEAGKREVDNWVILQESERYEHYVYEDVSDGMVPDLSGVVPDRNGKLPDASTMALAAVPDTNPNTWINTGIQALDIVEVAKNQVGYHAASDNRNKYNQWFYGADFPYAWCAVFICWCANQAEIPETIIPRNKVASGFTVKTMQNNSFQCPAFLLQDKDPKPGDIAYIDNNMNGTTNHVGLIVDVDDNYIYTVEGNYSKQTKKGVYRRSDNHRLNDTGVSQVRILFCVRPNYQGSNLAAAGKADYSVYQMSADAPLEIRSSASSTAAVIGKLPEPKTLVVFEVDNGWARIGYGGKSGWICICDGPYLYATVVKEGQDTVVGRKCGMNKNQEGRWCYYQDGEIDTTYTGLAQNQYGWWYFQEGQLNSTYTGMAPVGKDMAYVQEGKWDTSLKGLIKIDGIWTYINQGKFDGSYSGLAKNQYGWYYVTDGILDLTYTGMARNEYGWYYVTDGKLDLTYTGLAENQYGWWYLTNGKLDKTYTGMAKNADGWWYVTNGKVDLTYTGMAKNQYGWFYMTNGKLDLTYTGMAKNQYGWYYMTNGKLNSTYTGLGQNAYGTWYFANGKLQSGFTGNVTINGRSYYIKKGKVIR